MMKTRILSIVALLLMAATGAVAQTETLLTTITATAKEQASYSTANVATVSFSYTAGGSSAYLANWGWWGYGWIATVTAAEGYTITKCIFYDDANRTATDSEAPFVVETTETDKTPRINGTPIDGGNMWSKGIKTIEVYGYAPFAVTTNSDGNGNYWSTFYNASATQGFTADANTTVYKAALNGTSSVTLTEVAGREIPAGKAVILKSSAASITLTPVASTTADLSDNVLKGGTTVTDGYDAYTLSRGDGTGAVGFYKFSGTLDGSKAHLEILTSASARSFIGFGDDNTTGIELPALADDEAAEWYSLDGRRLSGKPARKGIYVKDGQKYIIK